MPPLLINNVTIERVHSVKLLGVMMSDDLKWECHVQYICKKANKRIYFLRLLHRASVDVVDIIGVYQSVIRPVLEKASELWHSGLTKGQSDEIERVQRRVLRITHPGLEYPDALREAGLQSLRDRREAACVKLFNDIQKEEHCLHHLLPAPRVMTRTLRNQRARPVPMCKTNRFKNTFTNYGLLNLQ